MNMALDRDGHSNSPPLLDTLEEHREVFSLMEKMEKCWFFDNIFSRTHVCSSEGISSQISTSFSPVHNRRIILPETMTYVGNTNTGHFTRESNNGGSLQCGNTFPSVTAESFEEECMALNPSYVVVENGSIARISWLYRYEDPSADSVPELCELSTPKKESDDVEGPESRQENGIFKFKALRDKKQLILSRAVNSNTVHNATKSPLLRRRRILKEREKPFEKSTALGA